jgi:hypothetical protein
MLRASSANSLRAPFFQRDVKRFIHLLAMTGFHCDAHFPLRAK